MFFIQPYTIVDMSDKGQAWTVVCEATTRKACEDYLRAKRLAECDVFKEDGQELYRGMCKITEVNSG